MPTIVYPPSVSSTSQNYAFSYAFGGEGFAGASRNYDVITGSATPYDITDPSDFYTQNSGVIINVTSGSNPLQRTASLSLPAPISNGGTQFAALEVVRSDIDNTTELRLSSSSGDYWFVTGSIGDNLFNPTTKSPFVTVASSSILTMTFFNLSSSGSIDYWLVLKRDDLGNR